MLSLLIFKEKIRLIYGKYSMFILPIFKFALILVALILININIGYLDILKNPFFIFIIAVFCSVLPFSAISIILSIYLLSDMFSVSIDMFLLIGIYLLVIGILYYGFKPGNSYLIVVVPLLFTLKIPYVLPIVLGLGTGILTVIPLSAGIILYYLLLYVKNNIGTLTNGITSDLSVRYFQILNSILSNKIMYIMLLAFALSLVIVYLIHNLSINYSWEIAIVSGMVSLLLFIFMGEFIMNITLSIMELLFGLIISLVLAYVYKFFIFNIDYTRTEYTQFEDDEYYYYVKAVPKISIKFPDYKNEKINTIKSNRRVKKKVKDMVDNK
jgi:hypothetical protein